MRIISVCVVIMMWSAILAAQVRVDVGTALGFTTANAAFRELPGYSRVRAAHRRHYGGQIDPLNKATPIMCANVTIEMCACVGVRVTIVPHGCMTSMFPFAKVVPV